MPVCIGCGASYDDSEKLCPYCGRYKPEAQKVEINVKVTEEAGKLTCPSCHRADKAQKVSAIIASQTSRSQSNGGQTVKTALASALSKTPQAPKQPGNFELWMISGAVLFLIGLGIGIYSLFTPERQGEAPLFMILIGLGLLGKGFINVGRWAAYNTERRKWSAAMKRYASLIYCAGCDCIYSPGKDSTDQVQNMTSFLYSD